MRYLIFLCFFANSTIASPLFYQEEGYVVQRTESDAINAASQALYNTEPIKQRIKTTERYLLNMVPSKHPAVYTVGGIGVTLIQGRLSTKNVKNMNFELMGGDVRADIEYNLHTNDTVSIVKCKWNLN